MVPEELQVRLNAAPELKAAFEALTPGRRKYVHLGLPDEKRLARYPQFYPRIGFVDGRGSVWRTRYAQISSQ